MTAKEIRELSNTEIAQQLSLIHIFTPILCMSIN